MSDESALPIWEALFAERHWASIAVGSERQLDTLAVYRAPDGIDSRIVRGYRCSDAEALFNEWAGALQFPYYFGRNWAAFGDCISDLSWLCSDRVVVFIARADSLLASDPAIFGQVVNVLKAGVSDPVRTWSHGEPMPTRDLRFVFHFERRARIKAKLGALGDELMAIDLGRELGVT